MKRIDILREKLQVVDFKRLINETKDAAELKRYIALSSIKDGSSYQEAADLVKKTYRAVMNWTERAIAGGIEGLMHQGSRGGRPRLFPVEHESELEVKILELQKSKAGGRIIQADIIKMIHDWLGITLKKTAMCELLKKVRIGLLVARPLNPKTDLQAQEEFKKKNHGAYHRKASKKH